MPQEFFATCCLITLIGSPSAKRDVNDHVALNIPQHRDVKLNELPKQIFMLLPLLLHWLYFLHSGGHAPPQNGKIKPMKQQRQQHKNLHWQFIQLNIPMLRDVKPLNIPPKVHARLIPLSS